MASERVTQPDDHIPYPDELYPSESDEPLTFTAEDIAHAVERLEAGRDVGEYTSMRESDLVVLSQLTTEQWREVRWNPSLLPHILTATNVSFSSGGLMHD